MAEKLKLLLIKQSLVFAQNEGDLGRTIIVEHDIQTGDHVPIRIAPHKLPLVQQDECENEISSMLDKRVIEPGLVPRLHHGSSKKKRWFITFL